MIKRIRLLHVLEATAGGTRRHLYELIARLSRDEFDVTVACAVERDPNFLEDLHAFERFGARVEIIRMVRQPHCALDLVAILKLRRLFRARRFDVVHLHSSKAGFLGRLSALGFSCSIVYSPHAFSFELDGLSGALAVAAERSLAWKTDMLVAVSDAEARVARRFFPHHRVQTIRNAIDVAELCRRIERAESATPSARTFGLLGELRPQKDPFLLLEAARRVVQRNVTARFLLPNAGPMFKATVAYVREHHLSNAVSFVPTHTSLDAILRRIDVGVMPSRWEGMPYSLLDSFALGCPVIVADIPPLKDFVTRIEPDLIVRSRDPATWADALERWTAAPREKLALAGRRGRQLVVSEHSIDRWAERIADVYRQSLAPRIAAKRSVVTR